MSVLSGVKVFSDLCLYFAFAGAILPWFTAPMGFLGPAALCALGALLGGPAKERRWLLLPALGLPALSLLLTGGWVDILAIAPALLYTWAVVGRGRSRLRYGHYCDFFPRAMAALGLLLLFCLMGLEWRAALLYGGLFAVSGVFLLRQLRLGEGRGWRDKVLNLLALLAALGGAALLCLAVWGAFQLRLPLWHFISWFFYLLEYLFCILYAVVDWIGGALAAILPGAVANERSGFMELQLPPYQFMPMDDASEAGEIGALIIGLLLVAALAVLAVWLGRRMLGVLGRGQAAGRRQVQVERTAPVRGQGLRRPLGGTHREQVRACYRAFLKLLRRRGVEIAPSQTSADVQQEAAPVVDAAAAGALRKVYLLARYDEIHPVGTREAREAKEMLDRLRRE